MLGPGRVILADEVEAKAVLGRIKLLQQAIAQDDPGGLVNPTLEDRVLDSDTMILARLRDLPQSARSGGVGRGDIITYENQHGKPQRMEKGG
jgi:hypothetical protein